MIYLFFLVLWAGVSIETGKPVYIKCRQTALVVALILPQLQSTYG